jgi:hypothetical protein
MAPGTIAGAALAILTVLLRMSGTSRLAGTIKFFPLIGLIVTIHLLIAGYFTQINFNRAIPSLALLGIFFLGAGAIADLIERVPACTLNMLFRRFFFGLLVVGIAGCAGVLQPFRGSFEKPVFPFTEPSHLALVIIPFLIYASVTSSQKERILYIGITLVEALLLQNLTLLVGCLFTASISLKRRHIIMSLCILVPLLLVLDLSYYTERLDFSEETKNLSSLVFLQGWQFISESLYLTSGIGRGFQQLGMTGTDVAAADLIRTLIDGDLNLLDGGFNLSKLISEFGILGAILAGWYFLIALRAYRMLRVISDNGKCEDSLYLFCLSVILGYLPELVLRGAGYFTPTGLLLVTALILIKNVQKITVK